MWIADFVLPTRKASAKEHESSDEVVAYDEEAGRVHTLNRSALLIWRHCDGQTRGHELVAKMPEAFAEVSRVEFAVDLADALEVFRKEGLVEG